jgi:hypothetical protein
VFILVLGHGVTIALLLEFIFLVKCLRERVLLVLFLIRMMIGLLAGLTPGAFEPVTNEIRTGSHILWLVSVGISASLVVSAIRATRLPARSNG